MNYFDDYNDDDDDDDDDDNRDFSRKKSCNSCGKSNLTWEDDNGRWVLLESSGRIHKCPTKPIKLSLETKL